jgi:hypothetical protein
MISQKISKLEEPTSFQHQATKQDPLPAGSSIAMLMTGDHTKALHSAKERQRDLLR